LSERSLTTVIKWDEGKALNSYIYVILSVNKVGFIIIGRENAFMASVSQFTTMVVSVSTQIV